MCLWKRFAIFPQNGCEKEGAVKTEAYSFVSSQRLMLYGKLLTPPQMTVRFR